MLSPGEWYKDVPRDAAGNREFRAAVLRAAAADPGLRAELLHACKHDLLFYVNAFAWTFDPRTPDKLLPFVTYPFQDDGLLTIVDCVGRGRDLVIEKSRDMGASWISLVAMEWMWHFHPGFSFLMVSRKEDLVDAPGDPDSLFWKIDFVHEKLPAWLKPKFTRRKLNFQNLDTGSTIDGESTTGAAGVGGRRSAMFIDEFSRIEEGNQLLAGTADTTNCRIFNFTPFGTQNAAYRLARRGDLKKLRFHWSQHPEKAAGLYRYDVEKKRIEALDKTYVFPRDYPFVYDGKLRSPWYDGECARRANDREVAMMIDIDYLSSGYQFFDAGVIGDLQREYCRPADWEGDVQFDRDTATPLGLVERRGGPLRLWTQPRPDGRLRRPQRGYGVGGDLSWGTGATNSCLCVIDRDTGEQVGEYATPFVVPDAFAAAAVALCRWLVGADGEPARMCWEMAGPGQLFAKTVLDFGYENIYFRTNETAAKWAQKPTDTPGWSPTPDNKRTMLGEYKAALAARRCLMRSAEALEECLSFVHTARGTVEHKGQSETYDPESGASDPTGAGVNHGDRVIAAGLAWKVAEVPEIGRKAAVDAAAPPPPGSLAWRRKYLAADAAANDPWAA
jgi:hypothetical protein